MAILSKLVNLLMGQRGADRTPLRRSSRFQPAMQALETRDQPGSLGLGASFVAPSGTASNVAPTVQQASAAQVELKDQVNVEL